MNVGMAGYFTLRSDLYAPIDNPIRFFPIIESANEAAGSPIYWMPLKELTSDCDVPLLTASERERRAHALCYHYGDSLRPIGRYTNSLPSKGRKQEMNRLLREFDYGSLRYGLPHIDVLVVETSGMMGAAYFIDGLMRLLKAINPEMRLLAVEADMSISCLRNKIRDWWTDWEDQTIVVTRHARKKHHAQTVSLYPYFDDDELPTAESASGVCYVGNDYDRRDQMLEYFCGPHAHVYGRYQDQEFKSQLDSAGAAMHGPFTPVEGQTIESVYRRHGAGIGIMPHDCYKHNYHTARLSEISRGGAVAFCDSRYRLGSALVGEWCTVSSGEELRQKLLMLDANSIGQIASWQRSAMKYYTSVDRYLSSLWEPIKLLGARPKSVKGYYYNPYQDLCERAGIDSWR